MKCDVREINHRLRTPIAGILGIVKILEQEKLKVNQAAKKIRQLEMGKQMPIIALTAEGVSIKYECLSAGMNDILIKPFSELELNSLLYKIQRDV